MDEDDEVAGRTAALPRRALALEPDALPVFDTRGDAGPQRAHRCRLTASGAGRTRIVDEQAATTALPTGLREGEAAGVAARHAGAGARRADAGRGAGLGTAAFAAGAGTL